MDRILAALAFTLPLFWGWAANAGCMSEVQCDAVGTCMQVEICDEAMDVVHASPDGMTPIPAEANPLAVTPAAATATDAGCREVDICGTMTVVCD